MSEPPLPGTRQRLLLAKYGPLLTTPFFFGFSTHALVPNSFTRVFGTPLGSSISNTLFFASHLGIGIYLFTSKHLRNANNFPRFLYSIYGSTIFNFGTILVMSIVRSMFPNQPGLRLGVGLSAGAALLVIGQRYINYIDQIFDTVRFRSVTQ